MARFVFWRVLFPAIVADSPTAAKRPAGNGAAAPFRQSVTQLRRRYLLWLKTIDLNRPDANRLPRWRRAVRHLRNRAPTRAQRVSKAAGRVLTKANNRPAVRLSNAAD